jgi:hypothetical protein
MIGRWWLVCLMGIAVVAPADAGERVPGGTGRTVTPVVTLDTGLNIIPFVATTQVLVVEGPPFYYAYSSYASAYGQGPAAAPVQGEPTERPPSPVAASCLGCHAGATPEAGLDLSDLGRLAPEWKLKAVSRVVSDDERLRMPKGRPLAPAEIGRLLQELSQ